MSEDLLRHVRQLGGPNEPVQIDETVVAHPKRTRNHHARPTAEQWVFGMADTSGECHVQLVPDRTTATLVPIVQAHVAPGSMVSINITFPRSLPNVPLPEPVPFLPLAGQGGVGAVDAAPRGF